MITALKVFDEFLPNPETVRKNALDLNDFGSVEYMGHSYMGVGINYDPKIFGNISEVMGYDIKPVISFFRLGVESDKTNSFIHADTSCRAKWAGILYLSDPPSAGYGTAFWDSKSLKTHKTLEPDDPNYAPWINAAMDTINGDSNDEDNWVQTGLIGQRFNRFLVYPTSYFHSRWPRKVQGGGKEDGRLIWVVFFN